MIETIHSLTGISAIVRQSVFAGSAFVTELTSRLEAYGHEITADGGYTKASIGFIAAQAEAEDWLEAGLMRDVTIYDEAQQVIWNGFVNSIGVSMGGVTYTRGPVLEVSNRVVVVYSAIDTSTDPPTPGLRVVTAAANDANSQKLFGILVQVYSASGVTDTGALQLRDLLLTENKYAPSTMSIDISGASSNAAAVTLDLSGYGAFLEKYTIGGAGTGTQTINQKLAAILAAQPNAGMLAFVEQQTNSTQVPVFTEADTPAASAIKSLIALGDASFNRFVFGVTGMRGLYYKSIPTGIDYQYRLSSQQLLTYANATALAPWGVLPGKWVFVQDFLAGRTPPVSVPAAALRTDPRCMFIESLNYSAPFGLTLNGSKVGKLAQKIARLGVASA